MIKHDWKGCPFCGRYGYDLRVKVYENSEGMAWAECNDCHARGPAIHRAQGMDSSVLIGLCRGAWNARKPEDGMAYHALVNINAYKDLIKRRKGDYREWQSERSK